MFLGGIKIYKLKKLRKNKLLRKFIRFPNNENLINLKKSNAVYRKTMNKAKSESWEKYIDEMNGEIESKDLWKRLRKINNNNNNEKSICNIKDSVGVVHDQLNEIADIIGDYYHQVSSHEFLTEKQKDERNKLQQDIFPSTQNKFPELDQAFSFQEFANALSNTKDSAPGPDAIKYSVYKGMSHLNKKAILDFYNLIWDSGHRPMKWNHANILPIPKQKSVESPSVTRPINLINTRPKLFDKMVNSRLTFLLEDNNMIDSNQFGFRRNKTTLNSMINLNQDIQLTMNGGGHVQLISFDLEKAFDKIWPEAILKKIKELGIGGNMFRYIENFLKERSFNVKNGNVYSSTFTADIGIPQGSPLSSTLFIIGFQNLMDVVKIQKHIKYSAYADDLVLYVNDPDNNTNTSILQKTIDKLVTIGESLGLSFSKEKTKSIHFCTKIKNCKRKLNELKNIKIKEHDSIKILGLIYQKKYKWFNHIDFLKTKIVKDITLLKIISNIKYGVNQETVRKIIKALIIPKIRYAIEIYGNTSDPLINKINVLLNTSKRIMLSAFVSTPIEALTIESGVENFEEIFHRQNLITMIKMKSQHAVKYDVNDKNGGHLKMVDSLCKKFKFKFIKVIKQETFVKPWVNVSKFVASNIFKKTKEEIEYSVAYQIFKDFLYNHNIENIIYTDGSKIDGGSGYAGIFNSNIIFKAKVHPEYSIYNIEAMAIYEAVKFIKVNNLKKSVIATDSMSSVQSICNMKNSSNEIINRIKNELNEDISIMWIPGHKGFKGNELADIEAKEAASSNLSYINELPSDDFKHLVSCRMNECKQNNWNQQVNVKLKMVKNHIKYSPVGENFSKYERRIINRCRMGHSFLTHSFLISKEGQPKCKMCNNILSIQHIFECRDNKTQNLKSKHSVGSIRETFNDDSKIQNFLNFLKDLDYYYLI